jgi:hypothetical protein
LRSASARERVGDPPGEGVGLALRRRERLLLGVGVGVGDARTAGRLYGVEGPGELIGEPKPKPMLMGRCDGCPKPKPRGCIDAGAPKESTVGGCWVSGWAMVLCGLVGDGGGGLSVVVGGN